MAEGVGAENSMFAALQTSACCLLLLTIRVVSRRASAILFVGVVNETQGIGYANGWDVLQKFHSADAMGEFRFSKWVMKLFIFDGTGPYSESQYGIDFTHSFCSQMDRHSSRTVETKYYMGPGTIGVSTYTIACKGYDDIVAYYEQHPNEKIFLAGYSRGGVVCMQIAKWLNTEYKTMKLLTHPTPKQPMVYPAASFTVKPIPVEGMFLLDPVAKDPTVDGVGVPANVRNCYAMFRDQSIIEYDPPINSGDWQSYVDKGLVVGLGSLDPDRYARKFMHNCTVAREKSNSTTAINFGECDGTVGVHPTNIPGASHGAIGGMPWIERRADKQATINAGVALNSWLRDAKLPIKVNASCYYSAGMCKTYPEVTDAQIAAYQADLQRQAREQTDRIVRMERKRF